MPGNTFGTIFQLTTFGESHGMAVGGILDGCPAGLPLTEADMQKALDKRKPGEGPAGTPRKESDTVHILSGVFEGRTTGTPIAFCVYNENQRSSDYSKLQNLFRPGHADYGFFQKFGLRDHRGGGRSSGRETIARVAAGAVADILLAGAGISVYAAAVELGGIPVGSIEMEHALERPYFSADPDIVEAWDARVLEARKEHDTLGGITRVEIRGVPAGLGEPVFGKLDGALAGALMSVGAVKGVEIGDGFASARTTGSLNNDPMLPGGLFASNHAGGILGGISSGQDIVVRCAVKPISSIPRQQRTIDINGEAVDLVVGGRHDLSAIPRCVPVHKAMASLVMADMLLLQRRMGRGDGAYRQF
ncbi:MAG: chorismate synthase [Desulfovibrionaceae bacterium]|nr:chorismate synthase [Desulfovibrionaceae bacterium]